MLYYLLFWAILGFIIHFYIIFGTNLLTGGLAEICCFMPILVFRRKGISNGFETERNQLEKLFLEGNLPEPPWGAPPASCSPCCFLYVESKSSGSRLFRKSRSRRFHSIWSPFDILFLRNTEIGKKTAIRAGPPVSRLVPKMI